MILEFFAKPRTDFENRVFAVVMTTITVVLIVFAALLAIAICAALKNLLRGTTKLS